MTNQQQTILVTGATGKQGGAVLRHLLGSAFKLRALTRNPESAAAHALAAKGVELVQGDLDDVLSLKAALKDVWGVFAVQNTWEAGVEREEEQGKRIAKVAREAGVRHFVYSSVGSAERATGVPHFDNKWRVENEVRALGFPSHVILRPVFFMENLPSSWFLNGDSLGAAMRPNTKLQMVAVDDIGRIGARAFTDAAKLNGREIEIAGDATSMAQAATVLSKSLERNIQFVEYPISEVRKQSEDMALMLEWFERVGYDADIAAVEREFGPMTRLEAWAKELHATHQAESATALLRRYEAALNRADVDAIVPLYAPDAVFMAQHRSPAVGQAAIEAAYREIFGMIRLDIRFEIDEVVVVSPTVAFARTRSMGTTTIVANSAKISEGNQELFVLVRTGAGGEWKIGRYIFSTTQPRA
jgi:uncharacterized protein (TIGR02246 family)